MATSTTKQTIALFWQFTKPKKPYFYLGTGGAALATIVQDILPPIVIAKVFNDIQALEKSGAPLELSAFAPALYLYMSLLILGVILWRVQVWFVWQYEVNAIRNIAIHIFEHLQKLGRTFHADHFGGALVSQSNKLMSAYEKVMDEFTWSITTGVVAFTSSFIVLLLTTPLYAGIFFGASAIYFNVIYRRTKKTMKYDRALATSESERTAKLADMITNVSAVTSFAGEAHEKQLFTKQADDTTKKYFSLLRRVLVNDAFSHSMTASISITAFIAGVFAITVLNQPAGALFLAVNYTMQLSRRLWESNRVMRNLNRAFGDSADMTEILQLKPEIQDVPNAATLKSKRGDIKFKNVTFSYSKSPNKALFNDLSLHIKPGEKIGLVGHSGGGKTSITSLILRFMDLESGSIEIDGQDISKVTQTSLRRAIAYVPQEPLLFHRSLTENISYADPTASKQEIQTVAKMAHAHDFIEKLSDGYDTLVGERGVKLSGGQRQRVAIARAMVKNAPILVLDEATSALDSESEKLIQDALWRLMDGKTAIIIAHRLSTIQKMDRIIVMEDGDIVEQGSHKELIRQNGIYANLWAHQSGGFLEE